nr:hypothetical protein [Kibdelosporangium phytohabitans]
MRTSKRSSGGVVGTAIVVIVLIVVVGGLIFIAANKRATARRNELDNAKADARRWVERLGGQVMNLVGTDEASKQALADASERYTAAGSQMDQVQTAEQAKLVTKTAMEGLYYVRAAREAMGLDPGPALPEDRDQAEAGRVTDDRRVNVEGHEYAASARPGDGTPYYYPGGRVAGRPVPQGWYSEPWWKPALVAGAWGVGTFLLFDAMFSGMAGIPDAAAWEAGYDAGQAEAAADMGGGDGGDMGGGDWGDFGGGDF